jgi:hypothetical protein
VLEQFPDFGTVATILAKAVVSGNRAEVAPDKTNGRALRALELRKAERSARPSRAALVAKMYPSMRANPQ